MGELMEDYARFFEKRGIVPEIAHERAYDLWYCWKPETLEAAWPVQPRQRGWLSQVIVALSQKDRRVRRVHPHVRLPAPLRGGG
jgi:hypothetical protein